MTDTWVDQSAAPPGRLDPIGRRRGSQLASHWLAGEAKVRRGWLGEQSQWDQRRMDWRRTGVEPASTGVHGHPGNREVPFTFCGRGRQIKKVSSCNFSFERSHWLFRMEAAETSSPCDEVPTSLQKFPFIKIKKNACVSNGCVIKSAQSMNVC